MAFEQKLPDQRHPLAAGEMGHVWRARLGVSVPQNLRGPGPATIRRPKNASRLFPHNVLYRRLLGGVCDEPFAGLQAAFPPLQLARPVLDQGQRLPVGLLGRLVDEEAVAVRRDVELRPPGGSRIEEGFGDPTEKVARGRPRPP